MVDGPGLEYARAEGVSGGHGGAEQKVKRAMRCTVCGTKEHVWQLNLHCVVARKSGNSFEIEAEDWVCMQCSGWANQEFWKLHQEGARSKQNLGSRDPHSLYRTCTQRRYP